MLSFLSQHTNALYQHLFEHIYLSFSAIFLAIFIGLPLGIWSYQRKFLRRIILPLNNIFQTIPSLALLAFLVPFIGIGFKPTIITLMIYALLPITRNTFTGLKQIPDETIEAALGLGFSRWQRLRLVEMPLAMPVIITGIRVATAMAIGITTIAAFIGAGGLGVFITQGLSLNDSRLILLGAIPTALLALTVDALFAQLQVMIIKPKVTQKFERTRWSFVFLALAAFCWLCIYQMYPKSGSRKHQITIATKNFTESYLLGFMMKDLIQAKTNLHVNLKLNLGSTSILQSAMRKGAIDLYPEYTGTAYMVILHQSKILSANETLVFVRSAYKKQFNFTWLAPFGFSNSQTLAVREDYSNRHHIKTLSDLRTLAPQLTIAAPAAFIKRPDSLPALQKAYDLHFKKVIAMQPDLVYRAIKNKDVDVIEAFSTDARIALYHLTPLIDDKHIYPPYEAAPIVRGEILRKYPGIKTALDLLANRINNKTMQKLNADVEIQHQTPEKVARNYLRSLGFKV
ncbi:MAG: ABC transporter permease subunit [Coxiellaceae bacterium]|nr:ABC transporter permease subunit [Coxiellaceae bacterium]